MEYIIKQCLHGYMISNVAERGMYSNEIYAFSTLQEAQDYLPKLFEAQEQKQ